LAGALAAAKLNIPVAHVEAGLRSYHRAMPEEINRLIVDHLSTFLFCPTEQAIRNLSHEGIRDGKGKVVKKVGDVMYDAILHYSRLVKKKSTVLRDLNLLLPSDSSTLNSELRTPNYYLATLHRAENTDHPGRLKSILMALSEIGKNIPVLLPLHPRTEKMIKAFQLLEETKGIRMIDPVSYLDMIVLEKNAKAILTDSGGVQKEAYWLRVPCFTLRDETEWVETVESGWNVLVGAKTRKIVAAVSYLKERKFDKRKKEIFGDGRASEKIVQLILRR